MKHEVPTGNKEKRRLIVEYVREHEPVSQPQIADHFLTYFAYKDKNSARVSISRILRSFEDRGILKKETSVSESSGSLPMNVWSANDELSVEEREHKSELDAED